MHISHLNTHLARRQRHHHCRVAAQAGSSARAAVDDTNGPGPRSSFLVTSSTCTPQGGRRFVAQPAKCVPVEECEHSCRQV